MSKPPLFHVGQAVVCLGGKPWSAAFQAISTPKINRVYHVRHVRESVGAKGWSILLEEIINPLYGPLQLEQAFKEERFAPVELLPDEALTELKELLKPVTA